MKLNIIITMIHLRTSILMLFVAVFSCSLSSCKFGDGEDGLETLAKKKRLLNYHSAFALPSISPCDTAFVDLGIDGLNINWDNFSSIAILGDQFLIQKDTFEKDSHPVPLKFDYNRYLSANCAQDGNYSVLSYDFSSYAKHGNGEAYSQSVNIIYPYERIIASNGDTLRANADYIPMDFNSQDGLLSSIMDKLYMAMGHANTICNTKDVVLVDSACCSVGHDHITKREERIILDSKIAILRLSLIVQAQEKFSLKEYLLGKNMTGNYYIDQIRISNLVDNPCGISRAQLNLRTGWMEAQKSAVCDLILTDKDHFVNLEDIKRENAQQLIYDREDVSPWGTSIYVAIPCTDEGKLSISPMITVTIKQDNGAIIKLYGVTDSLVLKEGGYYVTSPIQLYEGMDNVFDPALVFMTPVASQS